MMLTMEPQILIYLPVKSVENSVQFFKNLGFTFSEIKNNEIATCMMDGKTEHFALLEQDLFNRYTKKATTDTETTSEVIVSIFVDSREKVDAIVKHAVDAGGTAEIEKQDLGWSYMQGFRDLDGHLWLPTYLDVKAKPINPNVALLTWQLRRNTNV
jgi:predicted lactoylglutathione lyase